MSCRKSLQAEPRRILGEIVTVGIILFFVWILV